MERPKKCPFCGNVLLPSAILIRTLDGEKIYSISFEHPDNDCILAYRLQGTDAIKESEVYKWNRRINEP